jgi:PTH1 family peptidyl-tRNA hydrolase
LKQGEEAAYGIRMIVGLGNPGPRYARTRHNAGFLALQELASRWGAGFRGGGSYEKAEARPHGREVILLRPLTFMNLSGEAVRKLRRRAGLRPQELLVLHDDIDLPAGQVRVKRGGSSGGHLGVQSLMDHLGSGDFLRVRLGVGRPPTPEEAADYVLEPLGEGDMQELLKTASAAADAVEMVLREGEEEAMRHFNRSGGRAAPREKDAPDGPERPSGPERPGGPERPSGPAPQSAPNPPGEQVPQGKTTPPGEQVPQDKTTPPGEPAPTGGPDGPNGPS